MGIRSVRADARKPRTARAVQNLVPHVSRAAALLRALANEQRLLIVCNLLDRPLTVGELNERIELSQSALSQHLAVLREADIVSTARSAQSITYALSKGVVNQIVDLLHQEFCSRRS